MQQWPKRISRTQVQAKQLDNARQQAQTGLYLGLLALYALGKMWPT